MVLDLLVLEEEVRQGRLTLDDFDGNFLMENFNEGYLVFDADSLEGYLPEGYCLYYGFNQNKKATYFVNTVDLLKAEGSKKWVDVCKHTQAREKDGIEIKRIANKIRKIDIKNGKKLTKKKWEKLKFSDKAKFSKEEWKIIKEYALPVKRAKRLSKLPKEVEQYTHNAISELADYFDIHHGKLPEVKLDRKIKGEYDFEKNKITIGILHPEIVYEEAGHCLHYAYSPPEPKKVLLGRIIPSDNIEAEDYLEKPKEGLFPLEMLFRIAIEEAIGFYCAKFGNEYYTVELGELLMYGFSENSNEIKNNEIVDKIMKMDLNLEKASRLCQGKISNEFLLDVHRYITNFNNLLTLAQHLGMVFGNKLWEQENDFLVKQLITSREEDYPYIFFSTKRFMKGLDRIEKDIRKRYKK